MENFVRLLNKGYSLEIEPHPKRMNGGWDIRFVWKASRGQETFSCAWEGFNTPEECINDLVKRFDKE